MLEVFGWNRDPFELYRINPNFHYWYPYAELETRYVLNEILPLDANIIDVGANVGLISIALAIDKPDRKILGIEPSRIHAQSLLLNTQHLGLDNIWLIENPLCHRSGGYKGQIWESNGIKRIEPRYPFLTLDQVFIDWNQGKVDLVKIDTDGYEFKILLGARKLLSSTKAIWSIEQITSAPIFATLILKAFMKIYGYKLIAKLDGENLIYVKKKAFRTTQKKISQALDNTHSITIRNYPSDGSIFKIDSLKFEIDKHAPKNLKLSSVGFEYSSSKSHTNILVLTTEVKPSTLHFRLPFIVLEGSLNVIVEDIDTGAHYSREVYFHEEPQIILAVPGQAIESVRITLRTGIYRKGNVVWTN
jgi:FkbM family methyltransferase